MGGKLLFSRRDTAVTAGILLAAVLLCALLRTHAESDSYVSMAFLLAVFLISRLTAGYFYGTLASLLSVVGVNYVFTYPYMQLDFSLAGYPVTFATMMIVSVITGAMTSRLKEQEALWMRAEREQLRSDLLRAVSHDLRTPLTAIIGSADALLADTAFEEPPARRDLIAGIGKDSDWLLRMVENMLSVTRLESDGASLRMQPELAEEIVGAAAAKFKKWHPDCRLVVREPEEVLMAQMDGILIEQVLLNLLDNAARHGGSGKEILLETGRAGQRVFFRVTDHGRGIEPAERESLFSERPAGTGGSDNHRGMGIGLSVCRTIIKAHHGEITADNHPQGGAVFQVFLPLMEVPNA